MSETRADLGTAVAPAGPRRPPNRAVLVLGAAALLLAMALAAVVTPSLLGPSEASVEVGFARDMYVHHDQAVLMALAVRERTDDTDLDTFAADVIEGQSEQQGMMLAWMRSRDVPPTSSSWRPMRWMATGGGHGAHAAGAAVDDMGLASEEDLRRLTDLPGEEAEVLFLQLMTRHHRAAVAMAQAFLTSSDEDEVVAIAEAVVTGQQRELQLLQGMLQERGASA